MCVSHAWCMYVPITHQYTSLHRLHPCLVPRAFYTIPILHILQFEEFFHCPVTPLGSSLVPRPFCTSARVHPHNRMRVHAVMRVRACACTKGSGCTRLPRKRPETWKRAAAKAKRARGEEYVSPSTGKTVAARTTGPPCSCKQKCVDRFTLGERADVVRSFYDLDDKDLQDSHLFGLIRPNAVKRRRPRAGGKTPRLATYLHGKCTCWGQSRV